MLGSETLEEKECGIQIGKCTGKIGDLGLTEMGSRGDVTVNQASNSKNPQSFVIGTCIRLKERKTYLVWNVVGLCSERYCQRVQRQFKEQAPKELDPSLQKAAQSSVCGPMINPHIRWLCPCTSSKQQNRTFSNINRERASVMNRMWVPVACNDLLVEEVEGQE
ncbi:hypothetical protein MKX03_029500 [Papaver bracteatum]|nr:hypothetical protein MKX03_029500 [Papaver bracteatum]